jgi:hypothetical protein
MPDITISVPDEWADLVEPRDLDWAKIEIVRDAIHNSADNIVGLSEADWRDVVGEPIPRVVSELERLQSLVGAARKLLKGEEAEQIARLTAIEGGK